VQKLHLVGFTTEHDGLILSARRGAKSGSYVLAVDAALLEAIDGARSTRKTGAPRPGSAAATPPRAESLLAVREVQARLRSGRTVEEVAAEAGVEPAWIARFAAPVLAEQARVIEDLRAAIFAKPRGPTSTVPIGASVQRNLAERGLLLTDEEFDAGWSAYQLFEHRWMVEYRYDLRGATHVVAWELDRRSGETLATDRASAQLALIAPPSGEPRAAKRAVSRSRSPGEVAKRAEAARKADERRRAAAAERAEAARQEEERRAIEAVGRAKRTLAKKAKSAAKKSASTARATKTTGAKTTAMRAGSADGDGQSPPSRRLAPR
jgi:hypothetical protein